MQDRRRKLASLSAIGRRACAPPWRGTECHSAQGLVQYLNQLTGNLRKPDGTAIVGSFPGNLIDPGSATLADASVAYMQSLGITPDKVQPQTCQACHDPHTTALRVEGDTPMLPSGFQVRGAGSGAICFVCHDSRNGARGDQFNGVYTNNDNPGTPAPVTSIGAPHEADQGDVVAGRKRVLRPDLQPVAAPRGPGRLRRLPHEESCAITDRAASIVVAAISAGNAITSARCGRSGPAPRTTGRGSTATRRPPSDIRAARHGARSAAPDERDGRGRGRRGTPAPRGDRGRSRAGRRRGSCRPPPRRRSAQGSSGSKR
jgi:hypothetical protein